MRSSVLLFLIAGLLWAQAPAPANGDLTEERRAEIAKLMQKARNTPKLEKQIDLYGKVLDLDPYNQVAASMLKDAKDQLQKEKETEKQAEVQKSAAAAKKKQDEATKKDGLEKSESALISGDLKRAESELDIVKKIAPGDPNVQRLDGLIRVGQESARRATMLTVAAGAAAASGLIAFLLFRKGKKDAYLEALDGPHQRQRYRLDKEIISIGAIPEFEKNKNDIVVDDPEGRVSRIHCEIHRKNNRYFLFDCNSANGTFVDRKRAPSGKPVPLKRGSRIELAGTCPLRLGFEKRSS